MTSSSLMLLILASYDYESLQMTLRGLDHTLLNGEKVVIILNGSDSLPSRIVEYVARKWSAKKPNERFVIRPLASPIEPFFAIKEVIQNSSLCKDIQYICKIDDDIIPLQKNWLQHLFDQYQELAQDKEIGFVTGLINNNCWGFNELVLLFDKMNEYRNIHCYKTVAGWEGNRIVEEGKIDVGEFGTIWQYPYLARWIHEWTSFQIAEFIRKVNRLNIKLIPAETYYSIGCILSEKKFWIALDAEAHSSKIDEKIIHNYCLATGRQKWAIMNEPMLHLFYNNHRLINSDLLLPIGLALSKHFDDPGFVTDINGLRQQFVVSIQNQWQRIIDDVTFTKNKLHNFLSNVELV